MGKITFRLFFIVFIFSLFFKKGSEAIAQTATQTFNWTGGNQTFVVPSCVTSLTVQAWGAGGGGGGNDSQTGGTGGGGAYTTSVLAVTPGTSLTIIVGGGGGAGFTGTGSGGGNGGFGLGNGGDGGAAGNSGSSGGGGGGGGGTGIMNGGTVLLVAGGGGGGGGGGDKSQAAVGGGGGENGGSNSYTKNFIITVNVAGGNAGASGSTTGQAGVEPGNDGGGGGGGGGGLLGGGGGSAAPDDDGAGGGGGGTSNGTATNGNGQTPGNSAVLAGLCGACSIGGNITGGGGNGLLVLSYNSPPPIIATISSSAGTCGIATATVNTSGGTGAYTYTWAPFGGNAAVSTNLTSGTYTVNITDAAGCTGTANTTIAIPAALDITANTTSITCNGLSTGSATATATGGTPPYLIGINSTPAQGGPSAGTFAATGLPAGSYTFGVQDALGCQDTVSIKILQPTPLTSTTTQTNVTCFGLNNGIATVSPAGGVVNYSYNWSPSGGTAATATGLSPQNYTVTVTDHNLCTTTSTLAITQPALPLTATITSTNVTCNGLGNGSATVTAAGGTIGAGYTYNWSPTGGTKDTTSSLTPQGYTVTITDANLCTNTATVNITQPSALTLTAITTSITCNGLSNGSATATASGGTGPTYTVGIIIPPIGGITTGTEVFNNLSVGLYSYGVQDENGCTITNTFTIAQPALPLSTVTTQTNVTCFGSNNGIATTSPAGGTVPYSYNWSPSGGAAATATGLSPQNYTVTVTDHNLCSTTSTLAITQPTLPLSATITSTNVTCNGLGNGSATVSATGGTIGAGYTYNWLPAGGTNTTVSNLTPQDYTVTITDANLCKATATVDITQPLPLKITVKHLNVTCNGLSDGSAIATVNGGTLPYVIGISSTPPQVGSSMGTYAAIGLPAGTYTFGVQDTNSCQDTISFTVTQPAMLAITATVTEVTCNGLSNGSATATATGGTTPYSIGINSTPLQGGVGSATFAASGLPAGTYTFGVQDANSCQDSVSIKIIQPAALALTATVTEVTCFGLSNGSATTTVNGGILPYLIGINSTPAQGGPSTGTYAASGLPSGTYTFGVQDANNCPDTISIKITQPPALTLTAVSSSVTCFGLSNGSATATATGGTAPYTYIWSTAPPQTSFTGLATGLSAISYTAGVQDAKGCLDSISITIAQPNVLTSTTTETNVTCFGLATGSATVIPTGGTKPYTYSWSPIGGTDSVANNLTAQIYTVTVTDFNLCTTISTTIVTQPAVLTASISISHNDSCYGGNNGSALASVSGGTGPYGYIWSNGNASIKDTALVKGVYTFTVTDAHQCSDTTSVIISQPPALTLTATSQTICIGQTATITANATGGNTLQTYTYSVAGVSANTATVNPISTKTYTIGVTDMKGCKATNTDTVFVRDSLSFFAVSPSYTMCNGSTYTLSATGKGGDNQYNYSWSDSSGTMTGQYFVISPTVSTIYTLSLIDNCGTPTITTNVNVTVNPLPKISFSVTPAAGCYPLSVTVTPIPSTQPPLAVIAGYHWNLGLGVGDTSNVIRPVQVYNKSGVFSVHVTTTSNEGCVSTYSLANVVTVYNHPVANFNYLPDPANILNPTILFTNTSTFPGSSFSSIFWQTFGDGSDSTSKINNPVHIYQDTGTYCVKLVATNMLGCKDTNQQCVVIKPYFTLYVPNAFSPNGDGINDVFSPEGEYVKTFDMQIFNRWGNVIYHSSNISNGWDGTKGGSRLEEDVYVYLINTTDALNKTHSFKGTVTLLR